MLSSSRFLNMGQPMISRILFRYRIWCDRFFFHWVFVGDFSDRHNWIVRHFFITMSVIAVSMRVFRLSVTKLVTRVFDENMAANAGVFWRDTLLSFDSFCHGLSLLVVIFILVIYVFWYTYAPLVFHEVHEPPCCRDSSPVYIFAAMPESVLPSPRRRRVRLVLSPPGKDVSSKDWSIMFHLQR